MIYFVPMFPFVSVLSSSICYMTAPQTTLGYSQRNSLSSDLIILLATFRSEGYRETRNKIGSLSPPKHLVESALGTFRFDINALTY